ncbi:hypothetical protein ACWCQL_23090 [Streptomyces sp. NPDC002073]|uniref:hypothetical protein n=1 Tax=Streptomyces sp. NBC_00239 TaxID=2903640 RepID=UPI002E2E7DE7|nr:hypothetical protein [Streptomyces sp. NBC_00239]
MNGTTTFEELLAGVTADAGRFGHREHVRLTWLAVRRLGMPAAVDFVGEGIRRTAAGAGAPGKFHVTMTRAWVELVAHHVLLDREAGFSDYAAFDDSAEFAERHPELLDRALLTRFYRADTLAGEAARTGWVEPDLAPLPHLTD